MDTIHYEFDRVDARAIGVVVVLGVVLDIACRLVPADLPYLAPFIFNAPIFAGTILFGFWYARGLRRTPQVERPARWRQVVFYLGVGAIYFVAQTRFEYAAQHMFFLNRVQQMTLGVFGPFLISFAWPRDTLVRGVPAGLLRAAGARVIQMPLRVLRHPLVAAVLMIVVTDVWDIPAVDFAAMIIPLLYAAMNLSMIGVGLLFWPVVLDPRPCPPARYSYMARMAAGFLTMFPQILASSYIALTSRNLYYFYDLCGRLYPSVSAMQDQLMGGIIQWIPPGMLNTAVLFVLLNAIRKNDERAARNTPIPPGTRVIEAKWTGR